MGIRPAHWKTYDDNVPNTERVQQALAWLEERGIFDRLNVIVVSDHGMTAVSSARVIFLDDYIDLKAVEIVDWSPGARASASGRRQSDLGGLQRFLQGGNWVSGQTSNPLSHSTAPSCNNFPSALCCFFSPAKFSDFS
jgi:predicted AlkP superfamily pyrophosphatase or phosphodiesterase